MVNSNTSSNMPITVPDDRGRNCGRWKINRTGSVSGTVLLQGTTEYMGITVFIPGYSFVSYTDDNGDFNLLWVPEGVFTVAAATSGYSTVTVSGVAVQAGKL